MSTSKLEIVWTNVAFLVVYHLLAAHGVYQILTLQAKAASVALAVFLFALSVIGIGPGAHRLWCHRAYKAKLPLKILLMVCNSIANQNSIYIWSRDHRVHHKFTDTDADPHNVNRGFFFAHMGWLLCKKHPEVLAKGKTVDLSDLEQDPIVMFQHRHYVLLSNTLSLILPTLVPWYFWNESLYVSLCVPTMFRYLYGLHVTWSLNSVAHMWGYKPYDKNIKPVENKLLAVLTSGEGWHNYHHTFPWDYKAAELGTYSGNMSTAFIDLMAKIGWAYDLKQASANIIEQRKLKTTMEEEKERRIFTAESYVGEN